MRAFGKAKGHSVNQWECKGIFHREGLPNFSLGTPTAHIRVQVCVPAPPLLIQCSAHAPRKVAADADPSAWVPAAHLRDSNGVPGICPQPGPAPAAAGV